MAEGFFDHDMTAAVVLAGQARGAQVVDDLVKDLRRNGEIKNTVAPGAGACASSFGRISTRSTVYDARSPYSKVE